jgi:serine/threonine-protein kinase RsbT
MTILGLACEARVEALLRDESDVVMARKSAREIAQRAGLPEPAAAALVTAVSEITRNAIVHGGGGDIVLGIVEEEGRRGVVAVVSDHGIGMLEPEQAMTDGYSTANGLGLGLASARRLVHDFHLESDCGRGTTVILKQWTSASSNGGRGSS